MHLSQLPWCFHQAMVSHRRNKWCLLQKTIMLHCSSKISGRQQTIKAYHSPLRTILQWRYGYIYIYEYMNIRIYIYIRERERERERESVCVCVCERERKRETNSGNSVAANEWTSGQDTLMCVHGHIWAHESTCKTRRVCTCIRMYRLPLLWEISMKRSWDDCIW